MFCSTKNGKKRGFIMDARIPKKSAFKFFLLSIITLGIYAIVFWHKLGKNVNALCEGDGKKTMKYGFAFFLSVITVGIYGIIWKVKLAERLKVNAERYELMIPEGGTEVALFSTLGIIALGAGIPISSFIIIKNSKTQEIVGPCLNCHYNNPNYRPIHYSVYLYYHYNNLTNT